MILREGARGRKGKKVNIYHRDTKDTELHRERDISFDAKALKEIFFCALCVSMVVSFPFVLSPLSVYLGCALRTNFSHYLWEPKC